MSLFIKYTASYLSCKHGIRKGDFWLCEKESNLWIAPWKVCNKSTYLRLQCEQVERIYSNDFPPHLRELMRVNRLIILTDTLRGMSFDEVNELYNLWLKTPPPTPYLDVAVRRSAHIPLERKCSMEVFRVCNRKNACGTSEESDVFKLESLLGKANLFESDEKVEMSDDYFWRLVQKPKSVGSKKD